MHIWSILKERGMCEIENTLEYTCMSKHVAIGQVI